MGSELEIGIVDFFIVFVIPTQSRSNFMSGIENSIIELWELYFKNVNESGCN